MGKVKVVKNKEEKPKKRKRKVAFITISVILAILFSLFLASYILIGSYFFKFSLDSSFDIVTQAPNDLVESMPLPERKQEWFDNIPKNVEEIRSDDGYKLKAYNISADNNEHKWVITIHGYRGNCLEMTNYAYHFYNKGFNVLMPDLKGHGSSEGKYIGMGYNDRFDVIKWINLIIDKDPEAKIVLHGVSMGGVTVMMTTGENIPKNVVCAIEDCGYSSVKEQFDYIAEEILDLPVKNFIMSAADLFVRMNLGYPLSDMDAVELLKKSRTPTLFIHGDSDNFVPFSMLDVVYNANNNIEKEKLVVEGATHAYSATHNPSLYFSTVFEFVDKYMA